MTKKWTSRFNFINQENHKIWQRLCIVTIVAFTAVFSILALLTPDRPIGESDDYLLPTISLERRLSLQITAEDIEQVKIDFPNHYTSIQRNFEIQAYPKAEDGALYPWYMATYSIACMPLKFLLRAFNLNQASAFLITNVLSFVCALCVAYRKLHIAFREKLILLLLLIGSPIPIYYFWISAEMFMASLVIISLVFLVERQYGFAALAIALAGSLNLTVMIVGIVILFEFLYCLFNQQSVKEIRNPFKKCTCVIAKNWKDVFVVGICFLPSLITPIFNYLTFGFFYLQAQNFGFTNPSGWGGRAFAYLFDLNFGVFPFYPILLPIFIVFSIIGLFQRRRLSWICFTGFIGTLLVFSRMAHINCGMTAMARYLVWILPLFFFFLVLELPGIVNQIFKNAQKCTIAFLNSIIILSAIFTFVYEYSWIFLNVGDYKYFSPAAKAVLEVAPALYNPYPATFVNRTLHIDGGYSNPDQPLHFSGKDGFVKKILMPSHMTDEFVLQFIEGSDKEINKLEEKLKKVTNKDAYHYLNTAELQLVYSDAQFIQSQFKVLENILTLENITLPPQEPYTLIQFPISVEENTDYLITCILEVNQRPDVFYVDFFGSGYDDADQKRSFALNPRQKKYSASFNSGVTIPETIFFRIVSETKYPISVLSVTVDKVRKL